MVAGGKAWRASTVIAGVNPKLLFDRLVPQGAVDADVHSRMHSWKGESATFRMNVALSELPKFTVLPKKGDHLTAGIIMAPSLGYMHRAWLDAETTGWSKQPIVEIIPSTLDLDADAEGQACRFALLPALPLRPRREPQLGQGARQGRRYDRRDRGCARAGFRRPIIGRQIHSPLDLERRFGLIGGDIFHGKMSLDQLFSASDDRRCRLSHAPPGPLLCGSARIRAARTASRPTLRRRCSPIASRGAGGSRDLPLAGIASSTSPRRGALARSYRRTSARGDQDRSGRRRRRYRCMGTAVARRG